MSYPKVYEKIEDEGKFYFSTDYGADYALYFSQDGYFGDAPYSEDVLTINLICLQRATVKPRPRADPRIEATVIDFLDQAFSDPELVVIYYCSQLRNKQAARHVLFQDWITRWNESTGDQFFYRSVASGETEYYACIALRSNPYLDDIQYRFTDYQNDKQ